MSNRYYTKERFGYDTRDFGTEDISRVTSKGKIGAIPDATECPGWDCTIEGQFCPQGLPGSSSRSYLCVNKKWTAAGGGGRNPGVTGRPQYSDYDPTPGYLDGATDVYRSGKGLPSYDWWVGSAAPYYDFPQCHIPYGNPCNFGSADASKKLQEGDCCFGASSCEANTLSSGGTCNIHTNVWNYAHDRRGADKDGCTLQPGSQCSFSTSLENGGTGCCKDYSEWEGSNYKCHHGFQRGEDEGLDNVGIGNYCRQVVLDDGTNMYVEGEWRR